MDIQKERAACELSMAEGDMELHKFLQKIFTFNEEASGGKERYNNHQKSYWAGWQAAKTQAIPEGFVLVPKEPTEEMYLAGTQELLSIDVSDIYDTDSIQVYKAMIEAAEDKSL